MPHLVYYPFFWFKLYNLFKNDETVKHLNSMLEYIKIILQKVSFDRKLFEKELRKAIAMLVPDEVKTLKVWCYEKFGKIYSVVLNQCFSSAV